MYRERIVKGDCRGGIWRRGGEEEAVTLEDWRGGLRWCFVWSHGAFPGLCEADQEVQEAQGEKVQTGGGLSGGI